MTATVISAATSPDPFAASAHRVWSVILERLEDDVARAEALLAPGPINSPEPVDPWHAPDQVGPIPDSLRPRAQQLLERQRAVTQRLSERIDVTGAQCAYADDEAQPAGPTHPAIYLDARL